MRTAVRRISGMMVSQHRDSLRGETFHLSPVYHAGTADPRHATGYLVMGEINEHVATWQLPCEIVQIVIVVFAVGAEGPIRLGVTSCELPADKERGPRPADPKLPMSELGFAACESRYLDAARPALDHPCLLGGVLVMPSPVTVNAS